MIQSLGVQGQKVNPVLELGLEKRDPIGRHIPVYPSLRQVQLQMDQVANKLEKNLDTVAYESSSNQYIDALAARVSSSWLKAASYTHILGHLRTHSQLISSHLECFFVCVSLIFYFISMICEYNVLGNLKCSTRAYFDAQIQIGQGLEMKRVS